MDKVSSCIERIREIRDMNNGIITNEQIQELFVLCEFDEKQKQKVFEQLERNNIIPVSEEKIPNKKQTLNDSTSETGLHNEFDEQAKKELSKKRFYKMLDRCNQDMKNNPDIAKQYEEEIPMLIEAIAAQNGSANSSITRKIIRAVMEISNYRVRERRKHGWVCGTHMANVRERFENWLQNVFAEDELGELMNCCAEGKELTPEQMNMIKVLLHNTPKTLVHPFISWLLSNDEENADA